MDQLADLRDALNSRKLMLFVGAGVSANLGVPLWGNIIAEMAARVDYDPDIFSQMGDNYLLAEYYTTKKEIGALRSWMDREFHPANVDIKSSRLHELIVKLDFPLIYTTNYDRWLEKAFEAFDKKATKIINVGDLTKTTGNETQIVKFHGDFDDDESIVLNESSYFERLSFESALDIKFRSDFLNNSILFIGYGAADINIRYLLYKLDRLWRSYTGKTVRPRSYIFLTRPNEVLQAVLEQRGVQSITSDVDDAGRALTSFLEKLYAAAYPS